MNCHCQLEEHPVRDVEPVKFVVQYLTQAAIKLPCPLLSLVHQQEQRCVQGIGVTVHIR